MSSSSFSSSALLLSRSPDGLVEEGKHPIILDSICILVGLCPWTVTFITVFSLFLFPLVGEIGRLWEEENSGVGKVPFFQVAQGSGEAFFPGQ